MTGIFDIEGKTDEELLDEYSVSEEGRTFVPAKLLDAIGRRQALLSNRKAGDPGTMENPIFKDGKAFIYSKRNELILWEDYEGPVPECEGESVVKYTLTIDTKPTEDQKRMIQQARKMPAVYSEDCPLIPAERLSTLSRFRSARPIPG